MPLIAAGPLRRIVGEVLHSDGELYELLECGHLRRGTYDVNGEHTAPRRRCVACDNWHHVGKVHRSAMAMHGFLDSHESELAIIAAANAGSDRLIAWEPLMRTWRVSSMAGRAVARCLPQEDVS